MTHTELQFRERCDFIAELARNLHSCGTSAPRLEGACINVARRLNVNLEIWSNPTGIILSFAEPEVGSDSRAQEFTRVLRLKPGNIDLRTLTLVDSVAEEVIIGRMDVAEGRAKFELLNRPARRSQIVWTIISFGVSAASVAALLRTSWADMAVSAVIGWMVGALIELSAHRPRLSESADAIAALLATLAAVFVASFIVPITVQAVIIASLIVLMPGLTLTTSIAELSAQNWVSGTARFAGATMVLLKLTFGTVAAMQIVHMFGWQVSEVIPARPPEWVEWVGLLMASFSFAVLFRAPRRYFLHAMIGAWLGYGLTRYFGAIVGLGEGSFAGGVFFAGLGVAIVSNSYGRYFNRPGALLRLTGIILLVPGSVGFRSLNFVMDKDLILGLDTAVAVLSALIALVAGLFFGNLLLPPRRNH